MLANPSHICGLAHTCSPLPPGHSHYYQQMCAHGSTDNPAKSQAITKTMEAHLVAVPRGGGGGGVSVYASLGCVVTEQADQLSQGNQCLHV